MSPTARLHRIYNKQSPDKAMTQTWAAVFDIDPSSAHLEDDVTACLMALRGEISLARQKLDELDVPAHLTQPGFDRLRVVASPAQLNTNWHSHRGNIHPPECRKVFEWAEWVLREDSEPDVADEAMSDLRAELESLEVAMQATQMSPYLRDFIQRQVDTIRSALRVYMVQGARPLQEALHKVAGAYTIERPRVEAEHAAAPPAAKSVLSKASDVIDKTAKVCDGLSKIGKFGEQAYTLAGTVGPLVLPFLQRLGGP